MASGRRICHRGRDACLVSVQQPTTCPHLEGEGRFVGNDNIGCHMGRRLNSKGTRASFSRLGMVLSKLCPEDFSHQCHSLCCVGWGVGWGGHGTRDTEWCGTLTTRAKEQTLSTTMLQIYHYTAMLHWTVPLPFLLLASLVQPPFVQPLLYTLWHFNLCHTSCFPVPAHHNVTTMAGLRLQHDQCPPVPVSGPEC